MQEWDQPGSSVSGGTDIRGVKQVLSATYGAGNQLVDVTSQVREMLHGTTVHLAGVTMNDKFGDPAYGVGKELKVEYTGYYVSMGEYAGRNVPGIKGGHGNLRRRQPTS